MSKHKKFWELAGDLRPYKLKFSPSEDNPENGWSSGVHTYSIIDLDKTIALATDGLSNPFHHRYSVTSKFNNANVGLDIYIESPKKSIQNTFPEFSWQLQLLYQVSSILHDDEDLRKELIESDYAFTKAYNIYMPNRYKTKNNRTGVLFGVKSNSFPSVNSTSENETKMISVLPLLPIEVDYIKNKGQEAVVEIGEKLSSDTYPGVVFLDRKSVV